MRFAFEWCGYRYRIIERVCERLVNDIDEIEEEKWW